MTSVCRMIVKNDILEILIIIFLKQNITMSSKIPKTIHQIWIGPNTPPWKFINTWKDTYMKKYPHWKYKLWRDIDIAKIKMMNKKYYIQERNYAGKADIARYEILFQEGGVYIDADCVWLENKSLDFLIDKTTNGFFVAREPRPNNHLLANSVIGSIRLNKNLFKINKEIFFSYPILRPRYSEFKVTGPFLLTKLEKYLLLTVFPSKYFYPIAWHNINDINLHKKIRLPSESVMFQYGYSTNNLSRFF